MVLPDEYDHVVDRKDEQYTDEPVVDHPFKLHTGAQNGDRPEKNTVHESAGVCVEVADVKDKIQYRDTIRFPRGNFYRYQSVAVVRYRGLPTPPDRTGSCDEFTPGVKLPRGSLRRNMEHVLTSFPQHNCHVIRAESLAGPMVRNIHGLYIFPGDHLQGRNKSIRDPAPVTGQVHCRVCCNVCFLQIQCSCAQW